MLSRRAVLAGLGGVTLTRGALADPPDLLAGIHPRADWKAAPAKAGGRPHVATRLALHHTAGPVAGSAAAPGTLRGIQAFHQRDKGWVDLAYHLFVDADGGLWEGRDPGLAGDTATSYDPAGYHLVCALGNYEEIEPSAALKEGIARVFAGLSRARGYPLDAVALHKELASTLCPGEHLAAAAPEIVARAKALAI